MLWRTVFLICVLHVLPFLNGLSGAEISPKYIECQVGFLAYDFSKYLLENVMTSVVDKLPTIFDALQLENCNATRPVPAISTRLSASENLLQNAYGKRIFVDPNQGNDRSVGDLRRPLRTLQAALLESRRSLEPATIILRGGRYQLDSTVVLDYLDNGVAIMNFPHEEPILSGGRELNLDWTPWPCPALASIRADAGAQPNTSCWSASTQGSGVSAADFNQLFIQDRRAIRARHPNAGRPAPCRSRSPIRSPLPRAAALW
jgi:hypothetical protein